MSTLSPISIYAGQTLSVGALKAGYRAYIAIRGGVDVPEAMGSRATFALGKLGGHNGRNIQAGDILRIGSSCITAPCIQSLKNNVVPIPGDGKWEVSVLPGPHDYPYFTKEGFQTLFSSEWKVHYNSNRLGVRLSGPKPQWAREDGGEAGIHPSNIHDSPYSIGSISFTGDEAIVLTCDGPSLGGFVVFANVLTSEMWKIGQMKPGDRLQLRPVRFEDVRLFDDSFGRCVSTLSPLSSPTTEPIIEPKIFEADDQGIQIVARLSGDRALLLEYGANVFDISNTFLISALVEWHKHSRIPGVTEFTPGVRALHVYYEPGQDPKDVAASVFSRQKEVASKVSPITRCRSVQLPLAFNDTTSRAAIQRYQKTIRAEAPWLPSNIDFLRDVNGLQTTDEIKDILLSANYLVLGLGDVYLGSPCAIPLDPRHRLFGTKYNPSRSFTPEGTVGIGGQYLCVYGMDSPGGYQLVGRTIPIWNRNSNDSSSALFKIFDHISFYPISEAELEGARKKGKHMDLVKISTKEFDIDEYKQWLSLNGLASSSSMMADRLEKVRDLPFFDQLLKPYIPTNSGDLVNRQAAADDLDGEVVRTVMPGRCWKCCVAEGDKVKANDELIWIEANKMEMKIVSPCAGKVVSLLVKEKDVLEPSDIVAVIKPL